MRVLVACESSGVVREAFRSKGHDAWSCDLLPAVDGSPHHIEGDALVAAYQGDWDLMIAHPPCAPIYARAVCTGTSGSRAERRGPRRLWGLSVCCWRRRFPGLRLRTLLGG